jgi:hypothetical protein
MMLIAMSVDMSQEMFHCQTWASPGFFPRRGTSFLGGKEARNYAYRLTFNSFKTLYIDYLRILTHLQLVPRSRKCGSIHPLPHISSWHNA